MNISDIKTRVKDFTGVDTSDTEVAARLLRFINDARREVAKKNDWNCLKQFYNLLLPSDITTGSVSINSGEYTVTGVGTAFADSMVGSYINFGSTSQSEYEWYRVSKVNSALELIIDAPYIGDSITGQSFTIRKIYHRIPGNVSKIDEIYEFTNPRMLKFKDGDIFTAQDTTYKSVVGTPYSYNICGIYGRELSYATGTLSGASGSRSITGGSTSFLGNVLPGDKVSINGDSNEYRVASIESNTSLTLVQKLTASATSATYSIVSNPDSFMIRLSPPTDRKAIIPISYYAYPFDLISDIDEDELTRRYGDLILDYVIAKEKRASDDNTWITDRNLADSNIREQIADGRKAGIWRPNLPKFNP